MIEEDDSIDRSKMADQKKAAFKEGQVDNTIKLEATLLSSTDRERKGTESTDGTEDK